MQKKTGLSKHFTIGDGCPFDSGRKKETLNFSLIDYYDTTSYALELAKHEKGPKCRCQECNNLKDLEDKNILKLGSFYGNSGLNERDEIVSKTRCNWKTNWMIKKKFWGKAVLKEQVLGVWLSPSIFLDLVPQLSIRFCFFPFFQKK